GREEHGDPAGYRPGLVHRPAAERGAGPAGRPARRVPAVRRRRRPAQGARLAAQGARGDPVAAAAGARRARPHRRAGPGPGGRLPVRCGPSERGCRGLRAGPAVPRRGLRAAGAGWWRRCRVVHAAVVAGQDSEVEVRDVTLPEIGAGQVRVRVAAAGVCHSDLSMINGTLRPQFPLVLGHEAAGVIAAVGPGVANVAPGDRVVVNWAPPCRRCWFCLNGSPHLCKTVEGVASLPGGGVLADGTEVHRALGVGAFAEEVVLSSTGVVPLPDGVPLDVAALLGCAVLTGVGAVRNTARVRAGESVVVIGLGGVGLSAIAGARLSGA